MLPASFLHVQGFPHSLRAQLVINIYKSIAKGIQDGLGHHQVLLLSSSQPDNSLLSIWLEWQQFTLNQQCEYLHQDLTRRLMKSIGEVTVVVVVSFGLDSRG